MKPLLAAMVLLAAGPAAAQVRQLDAMPADARAALNAAVSQRLAGRLALEGLPAAASEVTTVRDKRILDKIELDLDTLRLQRNLLKNSAALPSLAQQFKLATSARLEFRAAAVSNIPDDKLIEALGVNKTQLLDAAAKPKPDMSMLKRLLKFLPKSGSEPAFMLNPLTPVDSDVLPLNVGLTGAFNIETGRITQQYSRTRYALVGILADISETPYRHVCTGTLIAQNWFLTATHCFYDPDTGARLAPERLGVFFPFHGGSATVRRSDGQVNRNMSQRTLSKEVMWFGETSAATFPTTERDVTEQINAGNDVALVGLAQVSAFAPGPVPATVRFPVQAAVNPPLILAGYGLTNAAGPVGGLLLEVGLRRDIVIPSENFALLKAGSDTTAGVNGRICKGDSGGPVFLGTPEGLQGKTFDMVAIASGVGVNSDDAAECARGVQKFTRVDRKAVRDWLCAKAHVGC